MARTLYSRRMTSPDAKTGEEIERARTLRFMQYEAKEKRKNGQAPEPLPKPRVRWRSRPARPTRKDSKPPKRAMVTEPPPLPAPTPASSMKHAKIEPAPSAVSRPRPAPADPPPAASPSTGAPPQAVSSGPDAKPTKKRPDTGANQQAVPVEPANPLRVAEQSFYLDRELRECTARTMEHYHHNVGRLITWLEEHDVTEPTSITTDLLRAYLAYHKSRNIAPQTLHHYANCARIFCNFLMREEILTRSPMARVAMPRVPKKILPAFTVEEVRHLIDEAEKGTQPKRDKALILTLLDSGCRVSEFVALNVGDLDRKTGALMVRQGKGQKDRTTFIGGKALMAVTEYLSARGTALVEEALWLTDDDRPLTVSGVRQVLRRLAERGWSG